MGDDTQGVDMSFCFLFSLRERDFFYGEVECDDI